MHSFKKRSGALIYNGLPSDNPVFSARDLSRLCIKEKAIFCRWTTGLDISTESSATSNCGWWYCLKSSAVSLDTLTTKHRYRVRKGLKCNTIWIATLQDFDQLKDKLYQSYLDSIADYPEEYKHVEKKEVYLGWIKKAILHNDADIWFCRDNETDALIGFAHCRIKGEMIELSSVKLNPHFFKSEINAGLVYKLCEHYLNQGIAKYICDGERNIIHQTAYQDFLVSVLGFRKAPCVLNIVYHPFVGPFVAILYPFRNIIKKISKGHHRIYKVYGLLFQEQCAKESRAMLNND